MVTCTNQPKNYPFFPTSLCGVLVFDSVSRSSASSSPLSHTTTVLCHRLSFTHNLLTHRHTQLCHTKLAHTQLCHTPSFNTNFTQFAHTYTAQGRCAHVNRMISHKRFLPGGTCMCVCSIQTGDSTIREHGDTRMIYYQEFLTNWTR